jgi:hypothetical protein
MNKLTAAAIAQIRDTATRLGTQDPERIRAAVCPTMSQRHWLWLLDQAGIVHLSSPTDFWDVD